MKAFIYLVHFCLLFLFVTCDKGTENPGMEKDILGSWEFARSVGGFTGKEVILPTAGISNMISFSEQNKFTRTLNGQVKEEGTYQITTVKSIFSGKEETCIRFNNSDSPSLLSIRNDSLWTTDNHVEPYSTLYLRVRPID